MITEQPVEHGREQLTLIDPAVLDCGGMPPSRPRRESKSWRKFKRKALSRRFAGFSSLSGSMATTFGWSATQSLTGIAYNPTTNASTINKRQPFGTTQGSNTQSGGCDECFSFQQGVTAGGTVTLSLLAMTDLLQRANAVIARVKGYQFRVLSATDDSTISPAPTATSVGLVTNIGVATPSPLDFQNGGSGLTVDITVSAGAVTAVAIGAAGSGYPASTVFLASPVQTGGSGCAFAVITNSSGVPTSVVFITGAGGTGYTTATGLPTVVDGQYTILTGGAHAYFDPSATGFALVSSTQKQVKLINTDPANAITFEIDIYAAST